MHQLWEGEAFRCDAGVESLVRLGLLPSTGVPSFVHGAPGIGKNNKTLATPKNI